MSLYPLPEGPQATRAGGVWHRGAGSDTRLVDRAALMTSDDMTGMRLDLSRRHHHALVLRAADWCSLTIFLLSWYIKRNCNRTSHRTSPLPTGPY